MLFAIAIPQITKQMPMDTAQLQAFLRRAEELGYHSAWVQEQILGTANSFEPVTLLTYAAAVTRRLRLGSSVLLTPLRGPVQLAKSLATLDQLSGGRLIVGVGIGGHTDIYPAFEILPERRVARFTEGLRLMKRLWTEERVTFHGQFWTLDSAAMEPKPIQRPHPPIWFGARVPAALKRTAQLGDGFLGAGSSAIAEFKAQVAQLRQFLTEAKRDPAAFPIAKRIYIAVDADKARGLARLREWFGYYYGNAPLADKVALVGGRQEILDRLQEIRTAGAELLHFNPVFDELEQMELLAGDIVPALR
jgi:probable F420-dependent oxidoreductase